MVQNMNYEFQDELEENINIDLRKILLTVWNRKKLIFCVFICTLLFFIALNYILPKKYMVDTELYISKSNNTHMTELNPYVIEEMSSNSLSAGLLGNNGNIQTEIQLIESAKVMDNVIKENDIRVKKLLGIIKTPKYGQYVKTEKFIKKLVITNEKGTNIIKIAFKNKDKELAYNVVSSIIKNYNNLHTELNTTKSDADIKILENEYNKAKAELKQKANSINGVPQTALNGASNMVVLSAFSASAQQALNRLQGQFIAGQKSQIELQEETTKINQLAAKLEQAKLIKEISDSSKIVVLKEPQHLKDFEQVSPKLFWQIIYGILLGFLFSLVALIAKELTAKQLSYSMLGNVVIYNIKNEINKLKTIILNSEDKKIAYITFETISSQLKNKLKSISDIDFIKADISKEFKTTIKEYDEFILLASVNITDSEEYKLIKEMLKNKNAKSIIAEILI